MIKMVMMMKVMVIIKKVMMKMMVMKVLMMVLTSLQRLGSALLPNAGVEARTQQRSLGRTCRQTDRQTGSALEHLGDIIHSVNLVNISNTSGCQTSGCGLGPVLLRFCSEQQNHWLVSDQLPCRLSTPSVPIGCSSLSGPAPTQCNNQG